MAEMASYTVKIVFVDGEILIITHASGFRCVTNDKVYVVEKNGYRLFFNQEQVKYIGRQFDINN